MRKMTNDIEGYQLTMAGTGTPPASERRSDIIEIIGRNR